MSQPHAIPTRSFSNSPIESKWGISPQEGFHSFPTSILSPSEIPFKSFLTPKDTDLLTEENTNGSDDHRDKIDKSSIKQEGIEPYRTRPLSEEFALCYEHRDQPMPVANKDSTSPLSSMSPPLNIQQISQQMLKEVQISQSNGQTHLELEIRTTRFPSLRLDLSLNRGKIDAIFYCEDSPSFTSIKRALPALEKALIAKGLNIKKITLSSKSDPSNSRRRTDKKSQSDK